jgi:hypothetical protein
VFVIDLATREMLFGIGPEDVWTLAGVVTLLGAVECIACWNPERRAVCVDPLVVLRKA